MQGSMILMHKAEKVIDVTFDKRGYISNIGKVYRPDLMPPCIRDNKAIDLQRWVLNRSLFINRKDIAPLREFYGGAKFQSASSISLFDTYWFASPKDPDWGKYNAYDNWDCKKDSVFLMLTDPEKFRAIDYNSPNLTVPGREPRIWYRDKEQNLYLLYYNAQEEMGAYKIARESLQEHIQLLPRKYAILSGTIFTTTPGYTSKDVEQVPLSDYYNAVQQPHYTKAQNLQACCETFHIPGWSDYINALCEFDDKIGNDDRELSDVGILRDTNTLEIIGFAPM